MHKQIFLYTCPVVSIGLACLIFISCFCFARAVGDSMYPTIKDGDLLLVKKAFLPNNLTDYIVSFYYNESLIVCHRCLLDNGTHILTKGDNNQYIDGWTSKDKVIGIVVLIIDL